MMKQLAILLLICTAAAAQSAAPQAQTSAPAQSSPTQSPSAAPAASMPAAKPADVDTIDHIIAAIYDVISGPAGQARDWDRFRSLFIAEARLIPNNVRDGEALHRVLSPDQYVERARQGFAQQGFFESEASRKQERFANIAHIFSTYESRREKAGQPFARGINSIQLLYDGKRWYVVTIMWQAEDPKHPLPAEYVHK
jgi:hypothetical protein